MSRDCGARRDGSWTLSEETVRRNDLLFEKKNKKNKHHKECVTLEQTEQTQIKHVRNEKKKKKKQRKQTDKTRIGSWRSALVISGDL